MSIKVACQCGHTLKAPEAAIGRKVRCKACGALFRVPDPRGDHLAKPDTGPIPENMQLLAAFTSSYEDVPGSVMKDVPVDTSRIWMDEDEEPVARPVATAAASQPPRVPAGPEPWYYGFLVTFATWTMRIGLWGCVAIGALGVYIFMFALIGIENREPDAGYRFIAGLATMVIGAVCVVPVLLASAPVLLAVDAARNLRAIRFNPAAGQPGAG